MKKILLVAGIAVVLASGQSLAANNGDVGITVNVVSPINVTGTTGMHFRSVAASGTALITCAGGNSTPTATSGIFGSPAPTCGSLTVNAGSSFKVTNMSITHDSPNVTITNAACFYGANDAYFTSVPAGTAQTIYCGATIGVGSTPGTYTAAKINFTVAYD